MSGRILITGGSGFIGSHLLPYLPLGRETLLLTSRTIHAFDHLPPEPFSVINGDIARMGPWQKQISDCDVVIHMAVYHHARELNAPEMAKMDAVNISGMNNLLRALEGSPPQRFIFLSSVKVTEWQSLPDYQKDSFGWTYARSKAAAEEKVKQWAQLKGVELLILRVAPVYGHGNVANLGELFTKVAQKKFHFLGNGIQRKSLCSVENLVAVILCLLEAQTPALPQTPVLTISDGPAHTIREIVNWIARAAGVRPPPSILTNSFWWQVLRMGEKHFLNAKTDPYYRLIRAWLTETVHPPEELLSMGMQMPLTTEQAIGRYFEGQK